MRNRSPNYKQLNCGSRFDNPSNKTNTRIVLSGSYDMANYSDVIIGWNSSAASAKAENIFQAMPAGRTLIIKDEIGTAAVYNITITPSFGTIDGQSSYVLNTNFESVTLVADGISNWQVT